MWRNSGNSTPTSNIVGSGRLNSSPPLIGDVTAGKDDQITPGKGGVFLLGLSAAVGKNIEDVLRLHKRKKAFLVRVDVYCTMDAAAFEDFAVEVDIDTRIWIDVEALELKFFGE